MKQYACDNLARIIKSDPTEDERVRYGKERDTMSLFVPFNDPKFTTLAQMIYRMQFEKDPLLSQEFDDRRKRLMYADITYNISFLLTSVGFQDEKIFSEYAKWLYEHLVSLMKDFTRERVTAIIVDHYEVMKTVIEKEGSSILSQQEIRTASGYLESAVKVTLDRRNEDFSESGFLQGDHLEIRQAYLQALLEGETEKAEEIIEQAKNSGISLLDIYEHILAKTMHEIGVLWHRNIISVDKEHYATSVTQTVMSHYFEEIFSRPRKNKVLVSLAVGSELHEMGIRMLSDIFDHEGWDTHYLGAGVSFEKVMEGIRLYKPQLVALSVTMPPYLPHCEEMVRGIKEAHPELLVAVGGQGFKSASNLWREWGADYYGNKAMDLLKWAEYPFES
ncbi:cobalamin B12-binding domain-containing protein [Proteiniclasticum ruminis]|uniref:cobalamin B12-binding domain-containing protein n=1 Tax=Proteiniclasticum ruminis TaxID=398199 RepID=UPI00289B2C64|nr:cobalamin-dependent protein [Proteiniclasticum ruminis]